MPKYNPTFFNLIVEISKQAVISAVADKIKDSGNTAVQELPKLYNKNYTIDNINKMKLDYKLELKNNNPFNSNRLG